MNPTEQFIGTVLVNVLIGVFVYGQLTQKVKDLASWSKKHDAEIDAHGRVLMDHEGRISHIEGTRAIPRKSETGVHA